MRKRFHSIDARGLILVALIGFIIVSGLWSLGSLGVAIAKTRPWTQVGSPWGGASTGQAITPEARKAYKLACEAIRAKLPESERAGAVFLPITSTKTGITDRMGMIYVSSVVDDYAWMAIVYKNSNSIRIAAITNHIQSDSSPVY